MFPQNMALVANINRYIDTGIDVLTQDCDNSSAFEIEIVQLSTSLYQYVGLVYFIQDIHYLLVKYVW